jgi:predicted DNA-binding protein
MGPMRKTSVYLDDKQAKRLARLSRTEGRPQSQIIREAIAVYEPPPGRDRNFALAGNFERIDGDPRPISEIPEDELMEGFGEERFGV